MEAKVLKLRRNRKKEIFGFSLLFRQDFGKIGSDRRKWEKLRLFVEGSLSFIELWWQGAGVRRACLLFVEVLFSLLYLR